MTTNSIKAYASFFTGWSVKALGAKPTAAQLATSEALGARQGSKVALALAMYQRPTGATQGQVITACGGPQLNKLRGLVTAGKVQRLPMPNNGAGHTVYRFALKGKIKAPAKVKAKAKGTAPVKAATPPSTT